MLSERCETCRFYKSNTGVCRRYPPRVVAGTDEQGGTMDLVIRTEWPDASSDDWCGEYVAKETV